MALQQVSPCDPWVAERGNGVGGADVDPCGRIPYHTNRLNGICSWASNADLESKLISKCDRMRDMNSHDRLGRPVLVHPPDVLICMCRSWTSVRPWLYGVDA